MNGCSSNVESSISCSLSGFGSVEMELVDSVESHAANHFSVTSDSSRFTSWGRRAHRQSIMRPRKSHKSESKEITEESESGLVATPFVENDGCDGS